MPVAMPAYTSEDLLTHLRNHAIAFEAFAHPAVFTCEEAREHCAHVSGAPTKNLFLRDGKGRRHFLVTLREEASISLKDLAVRLDAKGLTFASSERLLQHLGITPGAVSMLALVNDVACAVEPCIDAALLQASAVQCHPLVNTATLAIAPQDLQRFVALRGGPVLNVLQLDQAVAAGA